MKGIWRGFIVAGVNIDGDCGRQLPRARHFFAVRVARQGHAGAGGPRAGELSRRTAAVSAIFDALKSLDELMTASEQNNG
jgi:hypothetical protein